MGLECFKHFSLLEYIVFPGDLVQFSVYKKNSHQNIQTIRFTIL